jgi:hypothetical protein
MVLASPRVCYIDRSHLNLCTQNVSETAVTGVITSITDECSEMTGESDW